VVNNQEGSVIMQSQGKRVLVIGGGVSGLSCAYHIAENGLQVMVLEKEDYLGGLASWYTNGLNIPRTYHHILSSDICLMETIQKLGVNVDWRKVKMGFHSRGKTYPMTKPLDLLTFGALPFLDRLRFGLLILQAKIAGNLENTELKEWVVKKAGKTVYERLIDPLVSSYFGSAEGITAAYLANRWKTESSSATGRLGYADIAQITQKLAAGIKEKGGEIQTNCEVTSLRQGESGFEVSSSGGIFNADYVVSTISTQLLARICGDFPKDFSEKLSEIQYRGVICVTYWLPRKSSDYYWVIMLDKQSPFVACFEHANLNPHMQQKGLVYAVAYCATNTSLWQMPDDEIAKLFAGSLPQVLKDFGQWEEYKVYRAEWATPVFFKGYQNPPIKSPLHNLYLAGISHIFPDIRSMGPAMRTGLEAAQTLLSDFGKEGK
jgi:protoporphyrinogen oxidase